MEFTATYVTADHHHIREETRVAPDIDYAAASAIRLCPDGEFVAAVRQTDLPIDTRSIHALFDKVRAHPDYVAGTVFVRDDFADPDEAVRNQKWIEEAIVQAGFEAQDTLKETP